MAAPISRFRTMEEKPLKLADELGQEMVRTSKVERASKPRQRRDFLPVSPPSPATQSPQSLSAYSGIPGSVRVLDRAAEKYGFKAGCIQEIYTNALKDGNEKIQAALKNPENSSDVRFVVLKNERTGEKQIHLSLARLGSGSNHMVCLVVTQSHGIVAASMTHATVARTYSNEPIALAAGVPTVEVDVSGENHISNEDKKYYDATTGCSRIIQRKSEGASCSYDELAPGGDLSHLPDQVENAPKLIRGLFQGGVQMAGAGLVHLDLKLDNILIGQDGWIKVADLELSSLMQDGRPEGNCIKGNLTYYSPEKHGCALHYFETNEFPADRTVTPEAHEGKILPEGHNVGLKDNVWGLMMIIGEVASRSTTPWCQLSEPFQARLRGYDNALGEASARARELAHPLSPEYLQIYHRLALEYLHDSERTPDGNLFGGLEPQTPMDDLVKRMAEVDPSKRITMRMAEALFYRAEDNPEQYLAQVSSRIRGMNLTQDNCNIS